jgi:glutathione S-transferase
VETEAERAQAERARGAERVSRPRAAAVLSAAQPPRLTLLSLDYSPWSERARWALEHHGLSYQLLQHAPFVGEHRLRKLAGKPVGRATAPLLLADGDVLRDSYDIALYADRHGTGTPLVPAALEPEIRRLNAQVDGVMAEGRSLVVAALLASDEALDETLPDFLPPFARRLLRPFSRYGTRWFARKYALDLADLDGPRHAFARLLSSFREGYAGKPYLFDGFTYADILFCSTLQGVSPVDDRYVRLGPAWRKAWTDAALAREFADLVELRDTLYAAQRVHAA